MNLRPIFDSIPVDMDSDELVSNRLRENADKMDELSAALRRYQPFIPKLISDELVKMMDAQIKEANDYEEYSSREDRRWYRENREENIRNICEQSNIVCDAIRERIGLLGLLESPA